MKSLLLVLTMELSLSGASWYDKRPSADLRAAESSVAGGEPLTVLINPRTPARRAASLRLTEEARRLIDMGQNGEAIQKLDRAIPLDPLNPYVYFFLAWSHQHIGNSKQSLTFIAEAERLFGPDGPWLSEVHALRGKVFQSLGELEKARAEYTMALRLDPANPRAQEGMMSVGGPPVSEAP